ncbi:MAG TPA: hypothetical protein VN428_03495, partial [Bryobacteraceae bacterium]|nr:hypothetical protein [Bryobacteraceae bacterium]
GFFAQYWPMFAFGIALYGVMNSGWLPSQVFGNWTVPASSLLAAAALAGALCIALIQPSLGLRRQTYFALACAALLWAASGFEHALPVKHLAARAFSGLGKMSYTVYLMHLPLVAIINPHVARLRLENTILSAWISVILTIPLMVVFYYLFERRWATAPERRVAERAISIEPSAFSSAEAPELTAERVG